MRRLFLPLLAFTLLLRKTSSQTLTQLPLNQPVSLSSTNLSNPPIYSLPQSSSPLTISVALCSIPVSDHGVRFFVSNNSAVSDPGQGGGTNVYEVVLMNNGSGTVSMLSASDGGRFSIEVGLYQQSFQVLLSSNGTSFASAMTLPLLGDTTANEAIIFSSAFDPPDTSSNVPQYPNYTLPSANLSSPTPPTNPPSFELLLAPTTSFPTYNLTSNSLEGGLPLTPCALKSTVQGFIAPTSMTQSLVLRDTNGWRAQWLVQGLQPSTNYTAYVIQDEGLVSGPINLVTKSASFGCPLVHSLPYCPLVSYSVPLAPPPIPLTMHDASTLPDSLVDPLLSYMSNFTTSLLTFACGRDWYSPLQSCDSCQAAYRSWLCSVSFPRCGEAPPSITSASSAPSVTPALVAQTNTSIPRNANLPPVPPTLSSYNILLPCLETCNAVDRACPNFLGFACPLPEFNAAESYGVGYIDGGSSSGAWVEGGGLTNAAQDRWGNIWCAG